MEKHIDEVAPGMANAGQPLEDVAIAGQPDREHFARLADHRRSSWADVPPYAASRGGCPSTADGKWKEEYPLLSTSSI